ncbi:MAG: phosphate signaling complex protein PhoU [Gammaproteobacteria bacterium]|nr:phosphate signaling complex protein PhoU [Gammaproteobacteria bacterium]
MERKDISEHISQQFNLEMEDLRNKVLTMGGIVEKNITDAITSVVEGDTELAERVSSEDLKVNAMEVAIDEECSRILARRQPAAGDLRVITMIIKSITDLERIGDEAEKIARMGITLSDAKRDSLRGHYVELRHLAESARRMLRDALDAFARMDVKTACSCIEYDDVIDEEYEAIMRQLITHMMEDPRNIRRTLDVIWCTRSLERIGDHAKNICEYIVYMVSGKDIRHLSMEEIKMDSDEQKVS